MFETHLESDAALDPIQAEPAGDMTSRKLHGLSDSDLVTRVLRGENRAFDTLAARHHQMLISILLRMMDLPDAQDVAQDALLKAYKGITTFRGESQFCTWLYRIAINTAYNHLKRRKNGPAMIELDALEYDDTDATALAISDQETPELKLIAQELEQTIARGFDSLVPELRDSLIAYEIDGVSYQDIADRMCCPVGTVRSRISRARAQLDLELRAGGYDPLRPPANAATAVENSSR